MEELFLTQDQVDTYIENHRMECKSLTDELEVKVNGAKIPDMIFHYTNDAGLFGIINSGEIWLGDAESLNDPTELSHLINIALDIIRSDKVKNPGIAQAMTRYLGDFHDSGAYHSLTSVFVGSFSSKSNNLDQWRAYADNGRGFSIGFDGPALEAAFLKWSHPNAVTTTTKLIYDDETAKDYISRIVEVTERYVLASVMLSNEEDPLFAGLLQTVITEMMAVLYSINSAFKNENYSNEDEFRFMRYIRGPKAQPDISVRISPYKLVRYIKFPWKILCPHALKIITSGPSGGSVSEKFANDLKRHFDLSNVEVVPSQIPYRC